MNFKDLSFKNSVVFVYFLAFFILGVSIVKDYGMFADEANNRLNGAVSFKYIYNGLGLSDKSRDSILTDISTLEDHYDKDYGVVFDLPLFLIEWQYKLTGTPANIYLRHYFIFFLFFIGVFYFYRLLYERYKNVLLALLGCTMLIISPRIFAPAFYNIKDSAFLSVSCVTIFYLDRLLKNFTVKNAVKFAVSAAIATNVRILGVLYPCVLVMFLGIDWIKLHYSKTYFRERFKILSIAVVVFAVTTFVIWPYLWSSPIIHFLKAFKHMARFRWAGAVVYWGEGVLGTEIPWHYIPTWMSITIPVVYIVCFLIGVIALVIKIRSFITNKIVDNDRKTDYLMLSIFFVPLMTVIALRSVMYGDWRHMYFTYIPFVYLAVYALSRLYLSSAKYATALKGIALVLILAQFISTGIWMVHNHPYQYLYYNGVLSNDKAYHNFDVEGNMTNKPAFLYISRKNEPAIILTNRYDNLYQCYEFLDTKEQQSKLTLVTRKSVEQFTDKVIDSVGALNQKMYFLGKPRENLINATKYTLVKEFSVTVDGNDYTTVYTFAPRNSL